MICIICVDERKGMMFYGRRQSQDRSVREDIQRECGEQTLYMHPYSYKMFAKDAEISIAASDDFMEKAGEGDYCFVENVEVCAFREEIEAVILYQWNRHYPADVYLNLDLQDGNWILERTEEFPGASHEKITKEVYKKK